MEARAAQLHLQILHAASTSTLLNAPNDHTRLDPVHLGEAPPRVALPLRVQLALVRLVPVSPIDGHHILQALDDLGKWGLPGALAEPCGSFIPNPYLSAPRVCRAKKTTRSNGLFIKASMHIQGMKSYDAVPYMRLLHD